MCVIFTSLSSLNDTSTANCCLKKIFRLSYSEFLVKLSQLRFNVLIQSKLFQRMCDST